MSFLQTDFTNRIIRLFNFHVKSFTEADYIYISLVLTDFIAGLMKPARVGPLEGLPNRYHSASQAQLNGTGPTESPSRNYSLQHCLWRSFTVFGITAYDWLYPSGTPRVCFDHQHK